MSETIETIRKAMIRFEARHGRVPDACLISPNMHATILAEMGAGPDGSVTTILGMKVGVREHQPDGAYLVAHHNPADKGRVDV